MRARPRLWPEEWAGAGRKLLCGRGFGRGLHRLATFGVSAAASAAIAAAAAAVAATMATVAMMAAMARATASVVRAASAAAVATAVAAIAVMATVAAAVAVAAAASAAAAAEIEQAGLGLLFAAHKGDAHEGKENGNTQDNNAVHPRILQLLTGTVS